MIKDKFIARKDIEKLNRKIIEKLDNKEENIKIINNIKIIDASKN